MSSPFSTNFSPTSNYSYSSDLSIPPPSPVRQARIDTSHAPPPRLSSPHLFRDIFASEAAGPSSWSPPRLPPLREINYAEATANEIHGPSNRAPSQLPPFHGINYAETMQDVNRALQSANRALQTAQEAFQSRNMSSTHRHRQQDVVDLTNSPPSPSRADRSLDSFLTRTLHPHDSRPSNWTASGSLNEPIYPRIHRSTTTAPLLLDEDDPTSLYAGQPDSLAGARHRYNNQQNNHRRSLFMTIPNMERTLVRSNISAVRQQEEEDAIRRQRVAREQWEQNRHRQRQRERLEEQRDRIMARTQRQSNTTQSDGHEPQTQAGHRGNLYVGPEAVLDQTLSSPFTTPASVDAVDLTSVNNKTDLAAVLLHSQSTNRVADPSSTSTEPRSALTSYKCPVCLEPPRNATSTICGHLFCHECILETLKHSENIRREDAPPHRKVKGQCPVCRKELARKEDEGPTRTLVPLEIKLISKKKMEELRQKEKERKRQRELEEKQKQSKGKGKEKAEPDVDADTDHQVFELSSDEEDHWGINGGSQKENRAKRVKLSMSEELDMELFGEFTNDWQV